MKKSLRVAVTTAMVSAGLGLVGLGPPVMVKHK